jgi:HD-like signal output (HDOD) protein
MPGARLIKPLPNALSWAVALVAFEMPVLRTTAARLAEMGEHEDGVAATEVAEVVMGDPLMTAKLFARLSEGSGRGRTSTLGSVTTAVVMLGIPPFFRHFSGLNHIGEHLKDDHEAQKGLLKVVRRAVRAATYARDWAVLRKDLEAETIMMAALLHDLAEMLVWCAAPQMALEIRNLMRATPGLRSATAQRAVLGVTIDEIQVALMKRLHLPELLVAMNDPTQASSPAVRTVALAIRLARHSAETWEDPALPDDYIDIAALLRVSPQRVMEMVIPPTHHHHVHSIPPGTVLPSPA